MRDQARIPRILLKLKALWEQNPDCRLGQLFSIIHDASEVQVFYVEDDTTEQKLDNLLGKEGQTNQHQQTILQFVDDSDKVWMKCEICLHTYLCDFGKTYSKVCPRSDRH